MSRYGTADVKRHEDGRLEVTSADDLIGITLELIAAAGDDGLVVNEAGDICIAGDPAYRYRPIRFDSCSGNPGQPARVIVCERVR